MKYILILCLILSFSSCSLKQAADNDFKTSSSITPFAKTKKLDDLYGDKVKIKIPLTESSVGYFELEDVLGNRELNSKKKGFFKRFFDRIKLGAYNIAIGLGASNKIRYSTYFDFESIDSDFLKSAKITKVFFTTEDCRPEEEYCNGSKKITSNFNFVEKFFVNVSNYSSEETEGSLEILKADEFQDIARRSFQQEINDENFNGAVFVTESDEDDDLGFTKVKPDEINLVKFSNDAPELTVNEKSFAPESDEIIIDIKENQSVRAIKKYLQSETFDKVFKNVNIKSKRSQISCRLKKGVSAREALALIKTEQDKNITSKMIIFRLSSRYIATKKYFDSDKFKGIIDDSTMIGRSLYVELIDNSKKDDFYKILKDDQEYIKTHLDIYKTEKCDNSNCLDLDVKEVNLIPMLSNNPKLKIDSYISVKSLGKIDFKYNGFIEVEVDISLPL